MFINKEQLRDTIEDYRIMKGTILGYNIVTKKDFKHFAMWKDVNGVCGHLDHNVRNFFKLEKCLSLIVVSLTALREEGGRCQLNGCHINI